MLDQYATARATRRKSKTRGGTPLELPRRRFLQLAAGAAAQPAVSRIAGAQAYPTRPVRIIVPYAPDGYTLLFVVTANAISATLFENLKFNFIRDVTPVAGIIRVPNLISVNLSLP